MEQIEIPFSFQELDEFITLRDQGKYDIVHERLVAGRNPATFVGYLADSEGFGNTVEYMFLIWNSVCLGAKDFEGALSLAECLLEGLRNDPTDNTALFALDIGSQDIAYGLHEGSEEISRVGKQLFASGLPAARRDPFCGMPGMLRRKLAGFSLPEDLIQSLLEMEP